MAKNQAFIAPNAKQLLDRLKILEGSWRVTATDFAKDINIQRPVTGDMLARFVYDQMFLEIKTSFPDSPFPQATTLCGLDDTNEQFQQLYADDRQVYRVYKMTLNENLWTLQRNAPGFHQRFTGHFENEGKQIKASWEKSGDGKDWELDFNLLYEKLK